MRAGAKYNLNGTKVKLAKQTKALKFAITVATAKVRIAQAVKRFRDRQKKAGIHSGIEQSKIKSYKENPFVRRVCCALSRGWRGCRADTHCVSSRCSSATDPFCSP